MADLLPPLRLIPIGRSERLSVLYIERGQLGVLDGAFVFPAHAGMNRRRARHFLGKAPERFWALPVSGRQSWNEHSRQLSRRPRPGRISTYFPYEFPERASNRVINDIVGMSRVV